MLWSHASAAPNRHADLIVEAANRRLAGGKRQVVAETEQAARDRSRRFPLPWRPAVAR
jgi:hypothetical protein